MRTVSILLSTLLRRAAGGNQISAPTVVASFSVSEIKHQEHELRAAVALLDGVEDFLMLQQVVVDFLDGTEFGMRSWRWHERIRMTPIITVDIADETKVPDPLVDSEQVEVRCR